VRSLPLPPPFFEDYLNLIRYFTKDIILKEKITKLNKNNVEYKAIFNNNKIFLIHQLEEELEIKKLDVKKLIEDKPMEINDELINKINIAFRCEQIPETFNEYIDYYVNKLKNIFGKVNIIEGTRKQANKKRVMHYLIKKDEVKYYFDIHYYSCPYRDTLDEYLLEQFKSEIKIKEDIFIDNDDDEDDEIEKENDDIEKNKWSYKFCNYDDYEESCNFFNDMTCVKCSKLHGLNIT
jgi:hypothetical protein